ncbi:recombinase family protein [Enterococcus wangshanyuanii]|uniref:Resolvase/invertase-type recombinase catalytic domain-containing protein n=1 Tax=Enterococcus wangshanyuanii TaxID=2005703 RepID=A0ABQ1P9Z0_9ENTE|nr:recombinase family protein [Enterococcus wangshanyuanii]GGC93690.1 hypothetical protein GCM10011573_24160 [Enterococcus wangshanyuanii]
MKLGYVHGHKVEQQYDILEKYEVDEIFSDTDQSYERLWQADSELQRLLNYSESEDSLVISSLEVLSRDYQILLELFSELERLQVELIVLTSPELTLQEWQQVLYWVARNDRLLHPRLISVKMNRENKKNRENYTVFSRKSEGKTLYQEIFWLLVNKQKIRAIAKEKGIPVETVFRIQQEVKRMKLALIFVTCFFLAITTIKLTENFSDNLLIQVVVCIATTMIILYNALSDSE